MGGRILPWLPNVRYVGRSDRRRCLGLCDLLTYSCGSDTRYVLSGLSLPVLSEGIGVENAEPGRANDGSVWPAYTPGWMYDPERFAGSDPALAVEFGSVTSYLAATPEDLEGELGADLEADLEAG